MFICVVVEALRVVAAFSEERGEGCVWRASKDLKFFSARPSFHRQRKYLSVSALWKRLTDAV